MDNKVLIRRRQAGDYGEALDHNYRYWNTSGASPIEGRFLNEEVVTWFKENEIKNFRLEYGDAFAGNGLDYIIVFQNEQDAALFSIRFSDKFYHGE